MASTYSALKIQLMATGDNDGTWGDVTNANLLAFQDVISNTGAVSFAGADIVLSYVDSNAPQIFRNMRLAVVGTSGGPRKLTVPAVAKLYLMHSAIADTLTINTAATPAGIGLPPGGIGFFYCDSNSVFSAINYISSLTIGAALSVVGNATIGGTFNVTGNSTFTGTATFNGTVTFNATIIFAANVGVNAGFNLFLNNVADNSMLKVTPSKAVQAAAPGTDYVAPNVDSSMAARYTFVGTSAKNAMRVVNGSDVHSDFATVATGVINFDIVNSSVVWYYNGASSDWTINVRGSPTTPYWQFVNVADFSTIVFIVGQIGTFKPSITVDGFVPANVVWAGSATQPIPKPGGTTIYTFVIQNGGGAASFSIFASMTQFGV